jgi:hypothetical protein
VAAGLGDAWRALAGAMTAPDAPQHAQELMALQAQMLTVLHKVTGAGGQPGAAPGAAPPGAPPGGAPPGMPPGGGAPNLAVLQGGAQGPSQASRSPMSPEMQRQLMQMTASGGGTGT